ncbi:hypothetical protein MKEN_01407200 [Mycena kentingensis (nom. inval.)]|nr:hypothetical protein MKEN_01407200 [Mycena kentingensis (nom. inval.)]
MASPRWLSRASEIGPHSRRKLLSLPLELVHEILVLCGPLTLTTVRLVCRTLADILRISPSIWRAARARVLFGSNLPVPLLKEAATLEPALATLIFGGGKCYVCQNQTRVVPFSFSLEIRVCSPSCEIVCGVPKWPRSLEGFKNVDRFAELSGALPFLEGTFRPLEPNVPSTTQPLFLKEHYEAALKQGLWDCSRDGMHLKSLSTPVFEMFVSHAMDYRGERRDVLRRQTEMLEIVATEAGYSMRDILASPTLARTVRAFDANLEVINRTVWQSIEQTVYQEVHARVVFKGTKKACFWCCDGILLLPQAMTRHLELQHPEKVAEPVELDYDWGKCRLCGPLKMPFEDMDRLEKHLRHRHGLER